MQNVQSAKTDLSNIFYPSVLSLEALFFKNHTVLVLSHFPICYSLKTTLLICHMIYQIHQKWQLMAFLAQYLERSIPYPIILVKIKIRLTIYCGISILPRLSLCPKKLVFKIMYFKVRHKLSYSQLDFKKTAAVS